MFVTDTHGWLWYLSSDSRLGDEALEAFQSTDMGDSKILIPSIVIAESIYITEDRGYEISMSKIIEDLEISSNYILRPIDYRVLSRLSKDSRDLSIHDKIIINTAEVEDVKIISRDKNINELAETEVVW